MEVQYRPPQWIDKILEKFCDPFLWEGICGDLHEAFRENVDQIGYSYSSWIYFWQAIGFLRLKFKRKSKTQAFMIPIWKNYWLTSLRSIKRNKIYFGINLLGLIMAISCSMYAFVYIREELSYDDGLNKSPEIHRLYKRYINVPEGVDHLTSETSGMMGPTIVEEFPEITGFTRLCTFFETVVASVEDKSYVFDRMYFADSSFFNFFDYKLLSGDPKTALIAPSSVVISQSVAEKMFPGINPIGQSFQGLENIDFTITGVIEDPRENAHLDFDVLTSWSTTVPGKGPLNWTWMNNWLAQGINTYLMVNPGADFPALTKKFESMMNKHFEERSDQYFLKLQPWDDIYLFSDDIRTSQGVRKGSFTFVLILSFSALLILIIAIVNCINISLSKLGQHNLEIGVRKVMGSSKFQLVNRFIMESLITTTVALAFSFILLFLILPEINQLTNKSIPFDSFLGLEIIVCALLFTILLSLFIGLYPALIKSNQSLAGILQNSNLKISSFGWFRKTLLGLQYVLSPILIIAALMMYEQVNFFKNQSLGYNKDNLIVMDVNNEVGEQIEAFEAELARHPNIVSISSSRNAIGYGSYGTTVFAEGMEDDFGVRIFAIDQNFLPTYEMELATGRNFLVNSSADSLNILVNQTLVDFLGWNDPLGRRIKFREDGPYVRIVGVVEDFHYGSLAGHKIEPMILYLEENINTSLTMRVGDGDIGETLSYLEKTWNQFVTRSPLDYFFLDSWYDGLYKNESTVLKTASVYSVISIILSAIGLFGLTALALQQRSKEISIRKVLGANIINIIQMINRQFLMIILLSYAISIPLAYYLMDWWLSQFAYQIKPGIEMFAVTGLLVVTGSLLITTFLSSRAASVNPAKNLSKE